MWTLKANNTSLENFCKPHYVFLTDGFQNTTAELTVLQKEDSPTTKLEPKTTWLFLIEANRQEAQVRTQGVIPVITDIIKFLFVCLQFQR